MPKQILFSGNADPLSIKLLLINLAIGLVLSLILRWHFRRFGSTLSNREEFAQVFPFVLLTTLLIITVVKSSLALSLGLVGALSIVRFRTPIKEPEELAYLFITISIGLGLGANQTIPTIIGSLGILCFTAILKWTRREVANKNLYLSIDWKNPEDKNLDQHLAHLNEIISKHVMSCDLRRFDIRSDLIEANYLLHIENTEKLNTLAGELRLTFPMIGITFLDQNQLPSI